MDSGIAASTKWRHKTLVSSGSNVSISGDGVMTSSASSVASMRTTHTSPMTVHQLTSMPLGSSASTATRTSVTSQRPVFSTASAKWRNKWPKAPTVAHIAAKQPNTAPAPTLEQAAAAAAAAGAAAAATVAAQEKTAAASAREAAAPAQQSTGPQQQETTAASVVPCAPVPVDDVPDVTEPTPGVLEQPLSQQGLVLQSTATAEPIHPEQTAAAGLIESHETGTVAPTAKLGSELPEEVAPPVEQVEAAQPAESEQPEPVASTSAAAEQAPEPTPIVRLGASAAPAPTQISTEGPGSEAPAQSNVQNGVTLTAGGVDVVNGNTDGLKVALLNFDADGAPLADKFEIERLFTWRKLQPLWVEAAEHFPSDAEVLITTGTLVGSELLAKAPELKLVAVASDGYDHVDLDACKARGVAVVNVPGFSTDAAAELALGFVLAHLRNLSAFWKTLYEGFWTCPSQDKLSSKTVGIVGIGSLGLRLAELFKAFSVKEMLGYSPTQTAAFVELGGTYLDSLEDLFRRSDVVCICCSFSPETKGLVSESLLELLLPSSVLVNVAHGGVIDEDALSRFLAQGRFRAGLDVFGTEPLPANSSLRSVAAETLLATPHVGYQTVECLERRLDVTIKNILAWQLDQSVNRVA